MPREEQLWHYKSSDKCPGRILTQPPMKKGLACGENLAKPNHGGELPAGPPAATATDGYSEGGETEYNGGQVNAQGLL
jgi:hypothetical protein